MKIVILGCGRVGARIARLMEMDGHDVSIIDSTPAAFDRLPEDFRGQAILGTGIDVDVLKAAGIETADAFAAVTNFDNTNIMACEVAKEIFGVRKVLARIYDPGREDLYHQLGLETVCPTTLVSNQVREILSPQRNTGSLSETDTGEGLDIPEYTTASLASVAAHRTAAQKDELPGQNTLSSSPASRTEQSNAVDSPDGTQAQGGEDKAHPHGRGIRGLFRH